MTDHAIGLAINKALRSLTATRSATHGKVKEVPLIVPYDQTRIPEYAARIVKELERAGYRIVEEKSE